MDLVIIEARSPTQVVQLGMSTSVSPALMDDLDGQSHPTIGMALAVAVAGLTTLWFTRVKWAYCVDCALAVCLKLPQRQKKNIYLNGVYKPVDTEADSEDLKVLGQLPPSLDGVFARVGPNTYFKPTGNYHVYVLFGAMPSMAASNVVPRHNPDVCLLHIQF